MRICEINDIASVASELARGLEARGHEVPVIQPDLVGGSLPKMLKPLVAPARAVEWARIARQVSAGHFDAVHIHYAYLGMIGVLGRFPYILHCHGSDVRDVAPYSRPMVDRALAGAKHVYYSTPDLARYILPLRSDAEFLPNPIDTDLFRPLSDASETEDVLIGCALTDIKGADVILEACTRLATERPDIRITAIEGGEYTEAFRALPNVTVVPHQPRADLPGLISRHGVVIGQVRLGAVGMAELEAMACARPVVGWFAEDSPYDVAPPLLNAREPDEIAQSVIRLVDGPMARQTIGAAGREWVIEHHALDLVTERVERRAEQLAALPDISAGLTEGIPTVTQRLDDDDLVLPQRPLVSIVIPCLNEEQYITKLLDSLAAQDYGPDGIEVIVADGGSTDRTRKLVQSYPRRFARLELVDNPKRITVAGLNAGMEAARGDCWIILGAHSVVRSDFVRASVEALQTTGASCVGGPIQTVGDGTTGKAIAAAMSSPFGVGNAQFRYAESEGEVDTVPFGCYHRKVWEVVGRFDETVDGADEDSYNARIIEAGGRIVLVPTIRSTYYPRRTLKALAKQYWEYGAAKGVLLGRGRPLQPRHFAPSLMVAGGPGLLLTGTRWKSARWLLQVLAALYVAGGLMASKKAAAKSEANPLLTLAAMTTMHATYGAGFLWGAWREKFHSRA